MSHHAPSKQGFFPYPAGLRQALHALKLPRATTEQPTPIRSASIKPRSVPVPLQISR